MKNLVLLLLILNITLSANETHDDSIYKEPNNKNDSTYLNSEELEKPVKKYKKENKLRNNIKVSGTLTYRYDKKD